MKLENIEEEGPANWLPAPAYPAPETPTESMEFLARSWSVSASELSKALSSNGPSLPKLNLANNELEIMISNSNPTPTSSNEAYYYYYSTQNAEPVQSTESPPVSPRKSDDSKELLLFHQALNQDLLSNQQLFRNGIYKSMMKGRTMGRSWLKDQKEKKKQEHRTHNAHLHAAISVAAVAAAVASIAATSAGSEENKGSIIVSQSKTSSAMASAAALVASHCIEIAEEMGADHAHILSIVSSAINAKTNGDVMALTAGAATALRGAATLKARMEKGNHGHGSGSATMALGCDQEQICEERKETSFLTALNFVSKGGELLKRTRKGDLHWKNVSININSKLQVVAKMKSKHMGGTFTKKKKYVVSDICSDIGAWIGRDEAEEKRGYFGMKTVDRVIEFECRNKCEKQMWLDGIQYMLHCKASMA